MTRVLILLATVVFSACSVNAGKGVSLSLSGSYPRLILSKNDIEIMRDNAKSGSEPFASCFSALCLKTQEALEGGWKPDPYTGKNGMEFYRHCQRDGGMARDLALLWHITGNDIYSSAAVDILKEWTRQDEYAGIRIDETTKTEGGAGMFVSRGIFPFLYAFDLLMAGNVLPAAVQSDFQGWIGALVPVIKQGVRVWREKDYFDKQYYQNHVAAHALGLLSIGVMLGDNQLIQYALDSPDNDRDILDLVQGCILMEGEETYYREPGDFPVHDGEVYDRYRHFALSGHREGYVTKPNRGLQYCMLTGTLLVAAAEICRNNGFDLYGWKGANGERIPLIWDHYSRYFATHDCGQGIYAGEEPFINSSNQSNSGFWEIANARFPGNRLYEEVLLKNDRTLNRDLHLFGPVVITHGRMF